MPDADVAVRLDRAGRRRVDSGASRRRDDSVTGPALDFCLVVTQRRHVADTRLEIVGDAAAEWMAIAQAFAGGAGAGRQPGQFAAHRSVISLKISAAA